MGEVAPMGGGIDRTWAVSWTAGIGAPSHCATNLPRLALVLGRGTLRSRAREPGDQARPVGPNPQLPICGPEPRCSMGGSEGW